jgi:hypothetical protein
MKHLLLATALAALCAPAVASDIGVSVRVGEPGFYGQIDIGNMPPPMLVYAQPVFVERPPRYVGYAPIYMRVPPGHAKHWRKHCRDYGACGRPVYFVRDDWYSREYVPRYQQRYGDDQRYYGYRQERRQRHRDHDDRDD